MSHFEQDVDFNLSESGVHPVTVGELIGDDPALMDRLLAKANAAAKSNTNGSTSRKRPPTKKRPKRK